MSHFKAIDAMSLNRVIGRGAEIPWHLPEDFKWFKETTMGGVLVMGRRTFESIGRPLPNRQNIILSKTMDQHDPNTKLYKEIETFIHDFKDHSDPIFIIGGAQIYSSLIHLTQEIFLTHIFDEYDGDAKFPTFESDFTFNKKELVTNQFEICHYIRS